MNEQKMIEAVKQEIEVQGVPVSEEHLDEFVRLCIDAIRTFGYSPHYVVAALRTALIGNRGGDWHGRYV